MSERWTPELDVKLRELTEQGLTRPQISASLGKPIESVDKRRARLKFTIKRTKRQVPDDFREQTVGASKSSLCKLYRADIRMVSRWLGELDIELDPVPPQQRRGYVARFQPSYQAPRRAGRGALAPTAIPAVPDNTARQAAHFLQRQGPVFSCAILDPAEKAKLPDKGHDSWSVFGRRMSTADMIAKARAAGWSEMGWAA